MIQATIFSDNEVIFICNLPCWIVNGAKEIKEEERKRKDLLQKEEDRKLMNEFMITTKQQNDRIEEMFKLIVNHLEMIPEDQT